MYNVIYLGIFRLTGIDVFFTMWGPTQNLDPIGSAVLTFLGYKQTNRHPEKEIIYIVKSANFFAIVLYCTKRRCSHIEPHFKVKIKDGGEAP